MRSPQVRVFSKTSQQGHAGLDAVVIFSLCNQSELSSGLKDEFESGLLGFFVVVVLGFFVFVFVGLFVWVFFLLL